MECELCYNEFDSQHTVPKILKHCSHTYCSHCLSFQKQKDGQIYCPSCAYESRSYMEGPPRNKLKVALAPSQLI